jgi:hypothetical protein
MARVHHPMKLAAERKFPHRVDVPVPVGGLGSTLNAMLAWCRDNIHAETWAQHGHSEKQPGKIAQDFARFYFRTAEDADLFRWKWASVS